MKPLLVRPSEDHAGRWVAKCRECASTVYGEPMPRLIPNEQAPPFGTRASFPSLGSAHDGAVAHYREWHWTPEVAK